MSENDKITYQDFLDAVAALESHRPLDTEHEAARYVSFLNPSIVRRWVATSKLDIRRWSNPFWRVWMWLRGYRQSDIEWEKSIVEMFDGQL